MEQLRASAADTTLKRNRGQKKLKNAFQNLSGFIPMLLANSIHHPV
jgi:hypothetical protein